MNKLYDLAEITVGLVLKRKEAQRIDYTREKYRTLTLKGFNQNGWIEDDELDLFESNEVLDDKYITKAGDVIIRLSSPYTAISIDKKTEGLLIPSLFAVMRINSNKINSNFLAIYLNSEFVKHEYIRKTSFGVTIPTIRVVDLKEISIDIPSKEKQVKVEKLFLSFIKEKQLNAKIIEYKEKYYNLISASIFKGGK